MRTLQNLFIAYLYENMSAVPHEITFRILEDFDNSEALKKLSMEKRQLSVPQREYTHPQ